MADCHQAAKTRWMPLAVAFELGLAAVGGAIAWMASLPAAQLWPAAGRWPAALGLGVLATLPLLPLLASTLRSRWGPLVRLRRLIERFVQQLLGRAPLWQLAALSLAAGVGEELLFRGAIQALAVRYTTPLVGIGIASLVFGAAHSATPTYFWLATAIGVYFGCLAYWQGEIVSAMVAHALYDLVALALIAHGGGARPDPSDSTADC